MKVTEIPGTPVQPSGIPRPTEEELQSEYVYLLAEQIAKNILQAGLITEDEFEKLMRENRRTFSPLFARIMPESLDNSGV